MEQLREQLEALILRLEDQADFRNVLSGLVSVYPFNEFEYIISRLLVSRKLTWDEYIDLRSSYIDRNLFLYLFEISVPRGFGEVWAHAHLRELAPSLLTANKKLDPNYTGQYDLLLPPQIKIEVKASRAVEFNMDAPLYVKALPFDSNKPFDMNFQQLKPACCDVFIWVAAWRDVVKYWIIPSWNVEHSNHYSQGQHRGNIGEGQLHLNQDNIRDFDRYLVQPAKIETAVKHAFRTEIRLRGK